MKTRFLILSFVTIFPFLAEAQSRDYQSATRVATDSILAFMNRKHVPGTAISVMINGKIVWSKGFGYADVEQRVIVDPAKTKFRIASISKAITATGLAVLVERNQIQLDSSVYFYVPGFPAKKYRPTLRQLAGHTGGIRYYNGNEFLISRRYNSAEEGLEVFQNDSLLFRPGSKYQYSSYGFNLLSVAMEKASHENFLELIDEKVIRPLKLNNTTPDFNDSLISHRSRFYEYQRGKMVNAPYVDNSYKWAGGGFLSTSEDLVKFGNAYLRPSLLKKETIEAFTTSQKLNDGSETGYGMGWSSRTDKSGRHSFGHSGGAVGGTSDLVIYPEEKVVVVILTNLSSAGIGPLTHNIAGLFMK